MRNVRIISLVMLTSVLKVLVKKPKVACLHWIQQYFDF